MKERKIFDKQFVHFMWDDSLEGKKGFATDNIDALQDGVEGNLSLHRYTASGPGTNMHPLEMTTGDCFRFFYYDPLYDVKWAWKQGKQIQARVTNSKMDWVDLDNPNWGFIGYDYRVKPDDKHKLVFASNGCLSLDTEDVPCILYTGTKEQCLKYATDVMCSRCTNFKTCSPDDNCRGFKKSESKKKWRPFKDVDELKHTWFAKHFSSIPSDIITEQSSLEEPMIWVRSKFNTTSTYLIAHYCENMGVVYLCGYLNVSLEQLFDDYIFLDGTPLGVEE